MNTLLLVSDLHGQAFTLKYLEQIIDKEKPDGVIISGDITARGDTAFYDLLEKVIRRSKAEGFIVGGNSDVPYAIAHINNSRYSAHLRDRDFGKHVIFGLSETDDPVDISSNIGGKILITHRPPLLNSLKGKFKNAPLVHISGHIHTRKTAHRYPSTLHISVPTLQSGEYAILDTNTMEVEFSRIAQ